MQANPARVCLIDGTPLPRVLSLDGFPHFLPPFTISMFEIRVLCCDSSRYVYFYIRLRTCFSIPLSDLIVLHICQSPSRPASCTPYNMPYATHWRCEGCQQSFTIAGYVECPFCQHRRCPSCSVFAVGNRSSNYQSHSHSVSETSTPRPHHNTHTSSNYTAANQSQRVNRSEVASQRSATISAPKSSLSTDIYTCCKCDSEGPQVWQHNRWCSGCGHAACPHCTWYK